jgi:3-oxoacyl-[acyl-carrier-protein] synthase-3
MEKLGLGPEKVFVNIDKYGNTSSASIPIALDEAFKQGRLSPGDAVIFVAFGAGLTWGSAVVRL